jgi:hypothetical protein
MDEANSRGFLPVVVSECTQIKGVKLKELRRLHESNEEGGETQIGERKILLRNP